MILILALAGLAGFFFYDPLFYIGGFAALIIWVIRYVMRSRKPLSYGVEVNNGPAPSTMMISSLLTMVILAGILYFFFKWNGVAWMGIVFGILIPKVKYSYEKTSVQS